MRIGIVWSNVYDGRKQIKRIKIKIHKIAAYSLTGVGSPSLASATYKVKHKIEDNPLRICPSNLGFYQNNVKGIKKMNIDKIFSGDIDEIQIIANVDNIVKIMEENDITIIDLLDYCINNSLITIDKIINYLM